MSLMLTASHQQPCPPRRRRRQQRSWYRFFFIHLQFSFICYYHSFLACSLVHLFLPFAGTTSITVQTNFKRFNLHFPHRCRVDDRLLFSGRGGEGVTGVVKARSGLLTGVARAAISSIAKRRRGAPRQPPLSLLFHHLFFFPSYSYASYLSQS